MTYARMEGDWNIVYHETLDFAFKHGEPELFRMSRRCDYDCCSRIVDMTERWSSDTEEERKMRQAKIIEEFGLERCEYIMAATVRGNSRVEFSGELQKWAEGIRISDDRFVNATNTIISRVEPILAFIATVQRMEEEEKKARAEAEKAASESEEAAKADDAAKGANATEASEETASVDGQKIAPLPDEAASRDTKEIAPDAASARENAPETSEEPANETGERNANITLEGAAEVNAKETTEGTANGTAEKPARENMNETAQRPAEENAEEDAREPARETSPETAEENAEGSAKGAEGAEGSEKGAVEGSSGGTVEGSANGAEGPAQGSGENAAEGEEGLAEGTVEGFAEGPAQGNGGNVRDMAARPRRTGRPSREASSDTPQGASGDPSTQDAPQGAAGDATAQGAASAQGVAETAREPMQDASEGRMEESAEEAAAYDLASPDAVSGEDASARNEKAVEEFETRPEDAQASNRGSRESSDGARGLGGTSTGTSLNNTEEPLSASKGAREPSKALEGDYVPTPATMQYGSAGDARADEEPQGSRWLDISLPASAVIVGYPESYFCRMPYAGEYREYVFNIPAAFMGPAREGEGYTARIPSDFTVRIRRGDDAKTLSAGEFLEAVSGKGDADFKRPESGKAAIRLPLSALVEERERSYRFSLPGGSTFFAGKSLVKRSEDGFTVTMGESLTVNLLGGSLAGERTAAEVARLAEEADWENFNPKSSGDSNWRRLTVPKEALLEDGERRMLFKMPEGEFSGGAFYFPKKLAKAEGDGYVLSLPSDFEAEVVKRGEGADFAKAAKLSSDELYAALSGRGADAYGKSEAAQIADGSGFASRERALRENVPAKMRQSPNWVIVRTRKNQETQKLDEYFVSPVTGKFASCDDPSTWTDFDAACRFARENGGDTLAFALDGKGVCCLALDERDGSLPPTAKKALEAAPKGTYAEKSLSGDGVRIYGKLSEPMALRSFSRDGEIEFYRGSHFLSMTGEPQGEGRLLLSFDEPVTKSFLRSTFDKRAIYRNAGQGYEGVSILSDRELLDKAFSSKGGDVMRRLYAGEDVKGNMANSDMALMNRLAFWCNGDRERMLRLFVESGLYRAEKGSDYYESAMLRALEGIKERYSPKGPAPDDKKPGPEKPKDGPDKGGNGK